MSIQPFIDRALQAMTRDRSSHLGDRRHTVGASEVGLCQRRVVLGKLQPKQHDTRTLIRFSRGNLAEDFLADLFKAGGIEFERQVEVSRDGGRIKAHLDFLLPLKTGLFLVEAKSVHTMPPDGPWPSHLDQWHLQAGLLAESYNCPIAGSIVAIDLNAGVIKEFAGLTPNAAIYDHLINRAHYLLDCLDGKADPQPETGILCGSCDYRFDCPAYRTEEADIPGELESLARRYAELNSMKNGAEKELRTLKEEIISATGESFRGCNDNLAIIVNTVPPSITVDSALLRKRYPDVYDDVIKPKAGYSKLEVRLLAA
jgi:hypothetical protein